MKVLVLGATGMAGHTIALYLTEAGHEVTAFSTSSFNYCHKSIIGDATDTAALRERLQGGYDVVINAIGILNTAANSNHALAAYLNSYLPHLIADTLRYSHTKLIQMSTDCVFSGDRGSYTEGELPDGRTFYDRSKALGEVVDDKNLTFRCSIVGADMNPDGIGLFNWFMAQQGEICGYTRAIWTGVTTLTLAKAMEQAATQPLTGLYHLVNNSSISKHDLLCCFNQSFRSGAVAITKDDTAVTADKSLINTRTDFDFAVPPYDEMVAEMKCWVEAHRELYPHYFKEV